MLGVLAGSAMGSSRFPRMSSEWIDFEHSSGGDKSPQDLSCAASALQSASDVTPSSEKASQRSVELNSSDQELDSPLACTATGATASDCDQVLSSSATLDRHLLEHRGNRSPLHHHHHLQSHRLQHQDRGGGSGDNLSGAMVEVGNTQVTPRMKRPLSAITTAAGAEAATANISDCGGGGDCDNTECFSPEQDTVATQRRRLMLGAAELVSPLPAPLPAPLLPALSAAAADTALSCRVCGERLASVAQLVVHSYSHHHRMGLIMSPAVTEDKTTRLGSAVRSVVGGDGGGDGGGSGGEGADVLQCDKCVFSTDSGELMQQHQAQHKCSEWVTKVSGGGSGDLADISSILSVTRAPAVCSTVDFSGGSSSPPLPPPDRSMSSLLQSVSLPRFGAKDSDDRLLPSILSAVSAHSTVSTAAGTTSNNNTIDEDIEDPAFEIIRAMKAKGEFPCRLCGMVFPNLRAMKGHNRVHMSTSRYACNVCVFDSSDKATLVRHMKQHNGERPYECRLCRFAFTTKANCERHLKNRHQLRTREQLNDSMVVHATAETSGAALSPAVAKTGLSVGGEATPATAAAATATAGTGAAAAAAADASPNSVCVVCRLDFKQQHLYRDHLAHEHRVVAVDGGGGGVSYLCSVCDTVYGDVAAAIHHVAQHRAVVTQPELAVYEKDAPISSPTPPAPPLHPHNHHHSVTGSPALSTADSGGTSHDDPPVTGFDCGAGNVIVADDTPLDLSVGARGQSPSHEPSTTLNSGDPAVAAATTTTTASAAAAAAAAAAAVMGSPLGLYMRYGAPVPLFVMSSMLNESRELLARYSAANGGQLNSSLPLPFLDMLDNHHQQQQQQQQLQACLEQRHTSMDQQTVANLPLLDTLLSKGKTPAAVNAVTSTGVVSTSHSPAAAATTGAPQSEPLQRPKQRRYRTQRPFSCCYCDARFTLSTNMDRHIKNHHPNKWERRSRGGKRAGVAAASAAATAAVTTTTVVSPVAAAPSATAAATAATHSCTSPAAAAEAVTMADCPVDSTNGCASDDDSPLVIDEQSAPVAAALTTHSSRAHDDDLASVSRLVDSACARQSFRHFFGDEPAGSVTSGGAVSVTTDSTDDGDNNNTTTTFQLATSSSTASASAAAERRRSAYSAAPNKIPCRVCRREFPWSSSLRRHELTHSGQKPYSCRHCAVNFSTKSNCDRHMARKHGALPSGSPSADSSADTSTSTIHCQPTGSGPFWCPGCGDTLAQLSTAREHVQLEHEQLYKQLFGWTAGEDSCHTTAAAMDDEQVFCVVCSSCYEDIDSLSHHIHQRHLPPHTETNCVSPADTQLAVPGELKQLPERAKKREHLNDISARLSASASRLQQQVSN